MKILKAIRKIFFGRLDEKISKEQKLYEKLQQEALRAHCERFYLQGQNDLLGINKIKFETRWNEFLKQMKGD